MKVLQKDSKLSEDIKKKKLKDEEENKTRIKYLEERRGDKRFQKYIVEEILQKNISLLSDNRSLQRDKIFNGTAEEVKQLLFGTMIARETLEKCLSQIVNPN